MYKNNKKLYIIYTPGQKFGNPKIELLFEQ